MSWTRGVYLRKNGGDTANGDYYFNGDLHLTGTILGAYAGAATGGGMFWGGGRRRAAQV